MSGMRFTPKGYGGHRRNPDEVKRDGWKEQGVLAVAVDDAPPLPPPPPPPADGCAAVDSYDQPGVLGNQTRATATDINFNQTITAALCYDGDKDAYAFNGVAGQNVTVDLPMRPADYLVSIYNPDGQYVTGIYPGSFLQYGGSFTLNSAGRWTLIVWDQNLVPTTSQYELLLSVNTACSGLDPYEPNNDQALAERYKVLGLKPAVEGRVGEVCG